MPQVKATSGIADTFIQDYCNRGSVLVPRRAVGRLRKMRIVILMSLCAVAAAAAASISAPAAVQPPRAAADRPAVEVVRMAADSLVARRRAMPDGGSAWRSSIQAPHYHTDRDVGAASIGEGLLAAYAVTRDARYLLAARAAGDFLLGVAEPAAGGLRWPDWADPDGRRSDTHFTSFDDGAAGISDYLWTLYEVTHERVSAPARSPACAGWSHRRKAGPAPRPRARGAGRTIRTGAWRTTASAWARRASCSSSTRSPTARATRPSGRMHARAPRSCGS